MKHLREELWFNTPHRRDYINITDQVGSLVKKSGVQHGLCLVNAYHDRDTASLLRKNLRAL